MPLTAQNVAAAKSLNNFSDYANQSAEEMAAVARALTHYYSDLRTKQSHHTARFTCPVQPEQYYLKKARGEEAGLGAQRNAVISTFDDLVKAAEEIDRKCKALDTYHKLEDYKSDNYAAALKILSELISLMQGYAHKQANLQTELQNAEKKLLPAAHGYRPAAEMMVKQLKRERSFLDQLRFNLNAETHTGWRSDLLEKSILETDNAIREMQAMKPALKYPASSMWPSFISGLQSVLARKRSALDGYNHEAKKSDKYSNDVYLDLINYYNGVLVAHYNSFLDFASSDKFSGLKAMRYVILLDVRETPKEEKPMIVPFKDVTVALPVVQPKKLPVTKAAYDALENYVAFINESFRQIARERDVMRNLSSTASYYATLTTFSGKGGIQFRHEGFSIPLSYFQKAVAESNALEASYAGVLNQNAGVLLDILKEMDQIGLAIEQEVFGRGYERDRCKRIYDLIERMKLLYETWDAKKENLYNDLRTIFDSYPPTKEPDHLSWVKSGTALWELTRVDRTALFDAKQYYRGESSEKPSTKEVDALIRQVLSDEYDNMKGIEKYGRSNGRCPYTPYEDLPKSSRYLSDALTALKAVPATRSAEHPYHRMVYHYNDIVRYYNKFSELSQAPLLRTVHQPELFEISYPASAGTTEQKSSGAVSLTPASHPPTPSPAPVRHPPATEVTVIRDTVYIEKRDTVYLHDAGEDLRSMEGYATNNLVLLLDVSGSMNMPEKLPLLKQSVLELLSMMREEDEISIVVFSGKPAVLLKPASFRSEDRIRKAVQSLKPSGKTDANGGIKLAYKVANDNYIRGGNNRIVLATDGEFVLDESSRKLIADFSKQDIYLSVFNFGNAASTSEKLKQIAKLGQGSYEFISKTNVTFQLIREVKAKRKY